MEGSLPRAARLAALLLSASLAFACDRGDDSGDPSSSFAIEEASVGVAFDEPVTVEDSGESLEAGVATEVFLATDASGHRGSVRARDAAGNETELRLEIEVTNANP